MDKLMAEIEIAGKGWLAAHAANNQRLRARWDAVLMVRVRRFNALS